MSHHSTPATGSVPHALSRLALSLIAAVASTGATCCCVGGASVFAAVRSAERDAPRSRRDEAAAGITAIEAYLASHAAPDRPRGRDLA